MKPAGSDAYTEADVLARAVREEVADQVHDLVVERNGLGALDEVVQRVRRIGEVRRAMVQARGRVRQAEDLGMPVSKAIRDEREARELLRASLLSLAEACASVVVGLDVEERQPRARASA